MTKQKLIGDISYVAGMLETLSNMEIAAPMIVVIAEARDKLTDISARLSNEGEECRNYPEEE